MNIKSKSIINKVKSAYDKIADKFSQTRTYNWPSVNHLIDYISPEDSVLDLGCGNGRLYQLLTDKSIVYTGFDISKELIEIARTNYGKLPNVEFIIGDMSQALPFGNNFFNTTYMIASFHHLPKREDRINLLQELKRVSKNGAHIIMTNWNLAHPRFQKRYNLDLTKKDFDIPWKDNTGKVMKQRYYHLFDKEELESLFDETGLEIIDQYYIGRGGERVEKEGGVNLVSIVKVNK